MSHPIKFYRYPLSGHAHRVELMLSLLNLPFETVFVDLAAGAHKQPAFLALNSFGQVPVIEDRAGCRWRRVNWRLVRRGRA